MTVAHKHNCFKVLYSNVRFMLYYYYKPSRIKGFKVMKAGLLPESNAFRSTLLSPCSIEVYVEQPPLELYMGVDGDVTTLSTQWHNPVNL